ncbi:hypothetical protein IQ260_22070 [Leptolyngbya cf. ectocarpi LEGE 11479]|uniref:Uncharacterized protein n=1 Tax=Leptolyngbya cf. ectocarpi LEGE 11479 TaxID=1828722 RepID=A0A928ZXJ6_LEPEC|nr:hypothetical protein [Leptolyngbya ectocarpi]MBE9069334.1 hypothetical protein [Leptolyngbya cf. ectocarpi LEGE 11479]
MLKRNVILCIAICGATTLFPHAVLGQSNRLPKGAQKDLCQAEYLAGNVTTQTERVPVNKLKSFVAKQTSLKPEEHGLLASAALLPSDLKQLADSIDQNNPAEIRKSLLLVFSKSKLTDNHYISIHDDYASGQNPFCRLAGENQAEYDTCSQTPVSDFRDDCYSLNTKTAPRWKAAYCSLHVNAQDFGSNFSQAPEPKDTTTYFAWSDAALERYYNDDRNAILPNLANGARLGSSRLLRDLTSTTDSNVYLRCSTPPKDDEPQLVSSFLRIRGKPADLLKPGIGDIEIENADGKKSEATVRKLQRAAFKKYSAAQISLRNDRAGDTTTFSVNGSVGIPVIDRTQKEHHFKNALVFGAHYERSKTNSPTKTTNVHVLSPLAIWSAKLEKGIGFNYGAQALYSIDFAQEAKKLVITTEASPILGSYPLFLQENYEVRNNWLPNTGIYLSPSATLFLEAADILDPGTSAELAGAEVYYGIGGEIGVVLEADRPLNFFKNFSVEAGFRHLEFVAGDINLNGASRFNVGLNYALPGAEHLFMKLEYVDGRNVKTFQDENFIDVTLGLRF